MLLKMNKAVQASKEMDLAVSLWIAMLTFYESENGIFDEEKFVGNFPGESASIISDGMNKALHLTKLTENLGERDRQAILKALIADNAFVQKMGEANWQFNVMQLDDNLRKRLSDRYAPMYERLFSTEFRQSFIEEYKQVNEERAHMCPACSGYINLQLAEIDHYFPKSHYPTLAINSNNLMPLCKDCNSLSIKGNRHPTDPNGATFNYAGCLNDVFIPYHTCDAFSEMKITFNRNARKYTVTITACNPNSQRKINNIVALFNLEERWAEYIGSFLSKLYRKTIKNLFAVYSVNQILEKEFLLDYLTRYQEEIIDEKWINYFVEYGFIQWLISCKFDVFYDEIVDRMKEYSATLSA